VSVEALEPSSVEALDALAAHLPAAQPGRRRGRTLVFVLELALVTGLLVWWLSSDARGTVNGLLVLFLYCFPSEFLVALVPHEPVLIYFGHVYPALTVAAVSLLGTLVTEALNYHSFQYVADARALRRALTSRWVTRAVSLFRRRPFLALIIGALTPIPFYPFRFVVVLARYPLWRYLAAVALARGPRFYLLALTGAVLRVPVAWLGTLFLVLLLLPATSLLAPWLARLRAGGSPPAVGLAEQPARDRRT
jgi:membrane protein YqaA with SNARE-associated domain